MRALFFAATMVFITAEPLLAQRGRGGGGRGGGGMRAGGGGGFRGGGGGGYRGGGGMRGGSPHMSRSAARPSVSRPASRPAVTPRPSAPAMSNFRPNVGARPSTPAARPNVGRTPANIGQTRPNINQPGRDVGRPGRPDVGQPGRPDLGQPGRPNAGLRPSNPIYNNRPINNWDIDVDGGWGSGWGCCHYPWGAAAIGATAGYIAADAWDDDDYVVGNVTYALPSECTVTTVNGITYQQCGSTWYEPQFVGDQVSYIVVSPPQ